MTKLNKIVWPLAPMALAYALAADIYIPALPHVGRALHASATTMQLTLSLFMLGAGVAQLVFGPLSDQFGRRRISLVAIALFALGTLLCTLAHSATALTLYRIIQGSGAIAMLISAYAIVRDHYHGNASAKAYSYLTAIVSLSPLFAPFIGSYLDIHFGWRASFVALLLVALWATLAIYIAIPESLPDNRRVKVGVHVITEYKNILLNRRFCYYSLSTAFGLCYLFIFCSISPYIIMTLLHVSELHYGYYFAILGIAMLSGGLLSSFLVGKLGIYRTVLLGFFVSLCGGIMMALWNHYAGLSLPVFIWPMLFIGMGAAFGLSAGNAGAMEPFGHHAGAAAALNGAIRFLLSAIVGVIVVHRGVTSVLPLAIPAILFSLIGIVSFICYKKTLHI